MTEQEEFEFRHRLEQERAKASAPKASALPKTVEAKTSLWDDVKQGAGNLAAGALRGAGSIGATILTPIDAAARAAGIQNDWIGRTDRREAMDEGLRTLGAEPESLMYQGGKLGAEIAGTSGVGGALAKGAEAARVAPALVKALQTYGASAGASTPIRDLATRALGGAITGGVSAGMVNPEEAGTGAALGGALPLAMKAAKAGMSAGRHLVGSTTGVGDKALLTAYESGKAGGTQAQAFRDNMRGNVPITDVLDDARANVATMRGKASDAYRNNMAAVSGDKTVLDLAPVTQSIDDAIKNFTFKGQAKNPAALEALEKVKDQVQIWGRLDPAQFHTAEGLDALKQQIGATLEKIPFEARDVRKAVSGVYNSVKSQIANQAPVYNKTMKDYAEAADLISQIERSLLGGPRATDDAAMRKLQSVMRNNVNTNYGARTAAAEALEQGGGREIMSALAGQSMNNWMPRGIQRATSPLLSGGAAMLGQFPVAGGSLAISSPRLMGEAAHLAGRADPLVEALRRKIYQTAPVIAAD